MEQAEKQILVTWDFTEKSEFALEHAIEAAKVFLLPITILHIVKKDSERAIAEQRIKGVLTDKYATLTKKPNIAVIVGSIFNTISEFATESEAVMVFMGTHGIKGSQKFFGSWALKVIANSKVPFIVVQDKPKPGGYKQIVFPCNYRKENKECINWASLFSKYFQSKFHVFTAKHTDSTFIKGLESNIIFIKKYFKAKSISFEKVECPGKTDFVKEVVGYAKEINADAIMVMTTKDIGFTDYMLGAHEQYIIANESKIPVICVNPRPPKFGGSFSTSGS